MPEPLAPSDLKFIEKRRKLIRWWNLVGAMTFAGLVSFVAWMFWAQPRLINPLHVVGELEAGGIPQATLEIMAVLLPMVVLAIFLVLAVMIGFAFAVIGNERRYLRMIDRLAAATQAPHWVIYLGRKSCPPSRPPFEGVGDYPSLETALQAWPWYTKAPVTETIRVRTVIDSQPKRGVRRRDEILLRSRRTFAPRYTRDIPLTVEIHPEEEKPCTSPA